jgi:peptidoglycan hydrolase-like protein with peptidoglycan-binding domain
VTLVSANGKDPYKIFDSYDSYLKELHPRYDFYMAKVYFYRPVPTLFLKNLYFGMTHPDVPKLQKALIALGYPIPHGVTDFYGSESKAAVAAFQKSVGILDDGNNFGPRSRLALNKRLNPDVSFGGSLLTYLQALFSGV